MTKTSSPAARKKILAIVTVDIMAWKLLRPWLGALRDAGYEIHIACAKTDWFEQLAAEGFHMHAVPLRRRINPFLHILPLWMLYRLIRQGRFDVVNTHSPIAGFVGRAAAWLAGASVIIYTVHGFYFHDDMPAWKRRIFVAMEWLVGKITTGFMFVSDEDHKTALREGISLRAGRTLTIYNGVDLAAFPARPRQQCSDRLDSLAAAAEKLRLRLNIPRDAVVVGTVGRVVKEKGYIEFAEMARSIVADFPDVCFLVVGDALPSDRDGIVAELKEKVATAGLNDFFRFTGFIEGVADYLQIMDIFILASYREGFPRSVLEAMSSALPVIATNIRGCREAVLHGKTGLIVPPRNAQALTDAVAYLLSNRDLANAMGAAGRERTIALYDHRVVARKFTDYIDDEIARTKPGYVQTHP